MFSKNTEVTKERVHCRFAVKWICRLCNECEKLQFLHFLIEVYVVLVSLTLARSQRDQTGGGVMMLYSKPPEPPKSILLSVLTFEEAFNLDAEVICSFLRRDSELRTE